MKLLSTKWPIHRVFPVALCALLATCGARPVTPDARAVGHAIFESNVDVPMRDGVRLRADVMRPAGPGPFPVLVYRTPYDKEQERRDYATFARALERGYAVVVQDVRGRYASEGEFRPYQQEGRDGFDTIEWAAAQDWSSGAVGTFGLSYPGAVQWLAAVENPPHLKAMVPAMTFSSHENFIYARGPFDMSWIEWAWNEIAPDSRVRRHLAGPSNLDEAVAARVVDPREQDRGESSPLPVKGAHRREVDVGQHVAVEGEQGTVVELGLNVPDGAGGAQWLVLDHVAHRETVAAAVTDRVLKCMGQIAGREDGPLHAVASEVLEDVTDERPADQGHDRLGHA